MTISKPDIPGIPRTESTKRKAAETALGEAEQFYRVLVDAVADYAIFALDPDGHILTWNSGARRLKGYTADEVIGSHFSIFYTAEDIARNHPAFELEQATLHGRYEEEGWRVRKDGTHMWANVLITALKGPNGEIRGFAKVTRDLTERKLAEGRLQAAYESLERRVAERTAELAQAKEDAETAVRARDEFLSIASHELNTPLTTLKLQVQLRKRNILRENWAAFSPDRLTKMIDDDERQIFRIGRLVDDMLDITRLTAGKLTMQLERTELSSLVRDVISRFTPQLESSEIAVTYLTDGEAYGNWDRYRIEQVFTNLLTNAMKYGNAKPIHVSIKHGPTTVRLIVRDEGIGIAKADQTRIFQQFERAVSVDSVSGLGLGLYIVHQIVAAHDGKISLESQSGRGSTFTVELPLARHDEE